MLYLAFGLYLANMGVGLAAQTRRFHFGWLHHALYFIVFAAALLATLTAFHPALLLTLAALAVLPKSRPGTWRHPVVALVGLGGYLLVVVRW